MPDSDPKCHASSSACAADSCGQGLLPSLLLHLQPCRLAAQLVACSKPQPWHETWAGCVLAPAVTQHSSSKTRHVGKSAQQVDKTRQSHGRGVCLQTEKQRVIWAYKILFLDVLFPLNLRKVIFVDSDQVIRADFAQLWYMDMQVCLPCPLSPLVQNNMCSWVLSCMCLAACCTLVHAYSLFPDARFGD